MATKTYPILMHNDQRDVVKVGTLKHNEDRGTATARFDINTIGGDFHLFGKAMELGLVESLEFRVSASQFGVEQVMSLPDDESETAETP